MNCSSPKNSQRHQSMLGMTLVEVSLVVSLLLALIGIIFVGVTSFRQGSARAKCILRQAQLQKIAVSYANLNELNVGDSVPGLVATLLTERYITSPPACPGEGTYSFLDHIPNLDEHFATCSTSNHLGN